jgi:hypothetical protein
MMIKTEEREALSALRMSIYDQRQLVAASQCEADLGG